MARYIDADKLSELLGDFKLFEELEMDDNDMIHARLTNEAMIYIAINGPDALLAQAEEYAANAPLLEFILYKMGMEDKLPVLPNVEIVHCGECAIRRAVQIDTGMIWRCPHRTGDVDMDGFCESGVRSDEATTEPQQKNHLL